MYKKVFIIVFLLGLSLLSQGRIAYIADYDSLQIIDVSDPTNPVRLSALSFPVPPSSYYNCYDVYVKDTFAYVVTEINGGGRLIEVNISNPLSPYIKTQTGNIDGTPYAVYISGNYAFVVAKDWWNKKKKREKGIKADIEGGIRVVDISNPDSIYVVVSYDTPGDPRDVFAVDSIIYVADDSAFEIYKFIPAGIKVVKGKRLKVKSELLQNYPNPFSSSTVIHYSVSAVSGKRLAVSVKVYDITGREIKTLVNKRENAGEYRIRWEGDNNRGDKVQDGIYFCRLEAGRYVSTIKLIKMRGINFIGSSTRTFSSKSSYSYKKASVSSATIESLGAVGISSWGVYVQDTVAYIATRGSLVSIDVSDPTNPWILDSLNMSPIAPFTVYVVDTLSYITAGSQHFIIASVAKPDSLYEINHCDIPSFAYEPKGLMVLDTFAYVPDAEEGLMIINVADPALPFIVDSLNTPGVAYDIFVVDSAKGGKR